MIPSLPSSAGVLACSVIGAAHRRQGKPCQDTCLGQELRSPRGEPVALLLVADGHGGKRYWLSQLGSRLACEQAAAAVAAALAKHELNQQERWRQLLASELPETIQAGWLAAIERDWQRRTDAADHPFSPLTYGSTLGLVLLSPCWWGYTGLGDWDLVRLEGATGAELVSEEVDQEAGGEATASLCLSQAGRRWSERSQLVSLAPAAPPFTLLLSTDGVRKSCATDFDFLSLCGHLRALKDPAELEEGLAQITAAGSGDDVSVAMAHWTPDGPPAPPAWSQRPRQPSIAKLLVLAGVGMGLALGVAASVARFWSQLAPSQQPSPAPVLFPQLGAASQASLERESQRLCSQPRLITPSLAQRKPQFRGLLDGSLQPDRLMAGAVRDPLGALIAASFQPHAGPSPLSVRCMELRRELLQQWQLQRQSSGSMGTTIPS